MYENLMKCTVLRAWSFELEVHKMEGYSET
jgi:hypothetical protein